jgi:hypothetical protein
MKKTLIASAVVILLQGYYILKLRHDLDIRKSINEQTVMQVLNRTFDRTFECNESQDYKVSYSELPEPINEDANIVERIEMLEMHLDYNPSKKWIKDVLHDAKNKL